jgi:hypothetical protein
MSASCGGGAALLAFLVEIASRFAGSESCAFQDSLAVTRSLLAKTFQCGIPGSRTRAGSARSSVSNTLSMSCEGFRVHQLPRTLHPAPCTLHPAPCTLHPAPCTLHPAPCTLHPAPCTLNPVARSSVSNVSSRSCEGFRAHQLLQSLTPPVSLAYLSSNGNWSRLVSESDITDG